LVVVLCEYAQALISQIFIVFICDWTPHPLFQLRLSRCRFRVEITDTGLQCPFDESVNVPQKPIVFILVKVHLGEPIGNGCHALRILHYQSPSFLGGDAGRCDEYQNGKQNRQEVAGE
jgi:hypothetical protein